MKTTLSKGYINIKLTTSQQKNYIHRRKQTLGWIKKKQCVELVCVVLFRVLFSFEYSCFISFLFLFLVCVWCYWGFFVLVVDYFLFFLFVFCCNCVLSFRYCFCFPFAFQFFFIIICLGRGGCCVVVCVLFLLQYVIT